MWRVELLAAALLVAVCGALSSSSSAPRTVAELPLGAGRAELRALQRGGGRPVRFRPVAGASGFLAEPAAWSVEALLRAYGDAPVAVSAHSLDSVRDGQARHTLPLRAFINNELRPSQNVAADRRRKRAEPAYACDSFSFLGHARALMDGIAPPAALAHVHSAADGAAQTLLEALLGGGRSVFCFFTAGAKGAAVQFRTHAEGWHGLASGKQRFWLVPPSQLPPFDFPPTAPLGHYIRLLKELPVDDPRRPLELEVLAGQVLYIPDGWSYAMQVAEESIGVVVQRSARQVLDRATHGWLAEIQEWGDSGGADSRTGGIERMRSAARLVSEMPRNGRLAWELCFQSYELLTQFIKEAKQAAKVPGAPGPRSAVAAADVRERCRSSALRSPLHVQSAIYSALLQLPPWRSVPNFRLALSWAKRAAGIDAAHPRAHALLSTLVWDVAKHSNSTTGEIDLEKVTRAYTLEHASDAGVRAALRESAMEKSRCPSLIITSVPRATSTELLRLTSSLSSPLCSRLSIPALQQISQPKQRRGPESGELAGADAVVVTSSDSRDLDSAVWAMYTNAKRVAGGEDVGVGHALASAAESAGGSVSIFLAQNGLGAYSEAAMSEGFYSLQGLATAGVLEHKECAAVLGMSQRESVNLVAMLDRYRREVAYEKGQSKLLQELAGGEFGALAERNFVLTKSEL